MSRWYPNADGNKCPGSFQISIYYPGADRKVECAHCGRRVGLRNPSARQIAQHKVVPAQAAPYSIVGRQHNAAEMAKETQ